MDITVEAGQIRGFLQKYWGQAYIHLLPQDRNTWTFDTIELSKLPSFNSSLEKEIPKQVCLIEAEKNSYLASSDWNQFLSLIQYLPSAFSESKGKLAALSIPTEQSQNIRHKENLQGSIALVTGAAQGFGAGIAEDLCRAGAVVIVADIAEDRAREFCNTLNASLGSVRSLFLKISVGENDSFQSAANWIAEQLGSLDLFVSNAGVLRAGPLSQLSPEDFNFVTQINYTAYFLGVRALAPGMAARAKASGLWGDIIQINSKSGLEGSNRNSAYSGSKFGSIGLTQSFALELVQEYVKVNSICPGNFFDGPLWSDPQKGLFVQYLQAQKVPGAKTVEDVRRFYEAKVPMGRGCEVKDVMRALYYILEQDYETGQAVPVTGGQVMLN